MKVRHHILYVLASVLIMPVITPTVLGEEGVMTQKRTIEEITVTARKREENIQEMSIAVTAITKASLEDRALYNVMELDRFIPNLFATPAAGAGRSVGSYTIRGIGQLDFITTTEPGVGVYLDGVYLARTTGAAIDIADIERIEVLRGPQGTLFGRNATGGAISIISSKPNFEKLSGKLDVTAGAYTTDWQGIFKSRLSLNIPISEHLAARVNVMGNFDDGYGLNNAPGRGEKLGAVGNLAGRVSLLYTPSDELDFLFTFDRSRARNTISPMLGLVGPAAIGSEDPMDSAISAPSDDDLDVLGTSLTVNWKLGDINIRSISSYREQDGELGQDSDGSPLAVIDQIVFFDQEQFSQEFQFFGSAFNNKLDWLLGGFYFEEDGTFLSRVDFVFTPLSVDTFNETKSYAAFANLTYHLTDKLNMILGGRYSYEKKKLDVETIFGGITFIPRSMLEKSYSAISPKAAIEYFPTDNVMLYASYSEGFRSGGFNGRPFTPIDLTPFDEEINRTYEIGAKMNLFENTLRLNVSAFYSEYEDIQLTAIRPDPVLGSAILVANAGKAQIPGLELEARWLASDDLDIFASVGLIINDDISATSNFTLAGDTLPMSSEVTTNLGFNYQFPVAGLNATIGADWSYRSSFYHSFDNSELHVQEPLHLLNARLKLTPDASHWDVLFYVKNLTNEIYRMSGQETDFTNFGIGTLAVATLSRSREFGATLSYRF